MPTNKQSPTVNYTDLDTTKFKFTKPEENARSKNQNIGFIQYDKIRGNLLLKTPFVKYDNYGFPRSDDYHPTEKSRHYLRIPVSDENKEFFDKLQEMDDMLGSDNMKEDFFGKKAKKYNYIPIIRHPNVDEEEEPENVKPAYVKFVICSDYESGDVTTKVFRKTDEGVVKQVVSCMDDMMKAVPYLSTNQFIISPVKIWAKKPNMKDPDYGITFKVIQITTTYEDRGGSSINSLLRDDAYIGDGEVVESFEFKNTDDSVFQKEDVVNGEESSSGSESEESGSESGSESESEEEQAPPPKSTKSKKALKKKA